MILSIGSWISANWYWFVAFALMVGAGFLVTRLQSVIRERAAQEMSMLLRTNPASAAERLENNWHLKLVFRKQVLLLWKLDAYMTLGQREKALETIRKLDKTRLEPRDKLDFYQKRLSFFATENNGDEARASRDQLYNFLKKAEALKTEPYATIMDEADLIIGIYIDHNTGLIKKLIGRAEHTKNDIMRGVTQYRVAKLAFFKEDWALMNTYLNRAGKNLKGTYYEPIIEQAKENPEILRDK